MGGLYLHIPSIRTKVLSMNRVPVHHIQLVNTNPLPMAALTKQSGISSGHWEPTRITYSILRNDKLLLPFSYRPIFVSSAQLGHVLVTVYDQFADQISSGLEAFWGQKGERL